MNETTDKPTPGEVEFSLENNGEGGYRQKGLSRISDFGLTVEQCLSLSPLNHADVVAGGEGLSRTMSWVHVVDHSDIEDSLAGNELLLSSGIALSADTRLQTEIFEVMSRRNCAGLVVSIGVYMTELPAAMREAADRHGIPLIAVPWAVNFGDITRVLLTRLVQSHYQFMERAQRLNRDLLEIVLRRGDLRAVCDRMERAMGCAIYLDNEALQLTASSRGNRDGHGPLTEPAIRTAMVSAVQSNSAMSGETLTIAVKGEPIGIAVPVNVGSRRRGWMLLETGDRSNERIHALITEIGATVAALIITHEDELERLTRRQSESQLNAVLDGRVPVNSERAESLGLRPADPVVVMVVDIATSEPADALTLTRNTLKKYFEVQALATRGNSIVGLLQRPRVRQPNWAKNFADVMMEGGYDPRVGLSGEIKSHAQIPAEYTNVRETMKIGHVLRPADRVLKTEQMAVLSRAMRNLMNDMELKDVCPSILKLEEHDRSLHGSLITALTCLLDVDGNVSLAARMLGIHRHTMLYRMTRISEILGVELDSAARLELRLQLIAWQMAGK
jgi:purine catabolism regulator